MRQLNFGCGHRFAKGWVNLDFHSEHPDVQRVNLLRRWPFPNDHFDVVYSSHTLEHFSPPAGESLLRESWRVMKPGGIIRVVVPDLENVCREYVRLLDEVDHSEWARQRHEWIILELLDQMTRTNAASPMGRFRDRLETTGTPELRAYVRSRTDCNPWHLEPLSLAEKLRKLSFSKLKNKLLYLYLAAVKKLVPPTLRESVLDDTRIGEKHRWMYDRHNLSLLLDRCGFCEVVRQSAHTSIIPGFAQYFLDLNPDGTVYKPASLYCEARKPQS